MAGLCWFFFSALVFPLQAMRLEVDFMPSLDELQAAALDFQEKEGGPEVDTFLEAISEGHAAFDNYTCEDLQPIFTSTIEHATETLTTMCATDCGAETTEEFQAELLAAGELLMSAGAALDKKHCLVDALASSEARTALQGLIGMAAPVVRSAGSAEAVEALEKAWTYMVAWQQGTLELADPRLERQVMFPEDIETDCPGPCYQCTREHNSRSKGEEVFKFKCMLRSENGTVSAPEQEGLTCTKPQRRSSRFWKPWRWNQWKSWCTVQQWKDTACTQTTVTAMLSCGAAAIVNPLREGFLDMELMHAQCVEYEQGRSNDTRSMETFKAKLHTDYQVVPRQHNLAFGIFMSAGLSSGLGALRWASSGTAPDPPIVVSEPEELIDIFALGYGVNQEMKAIFSGATFDDCDELVTRMETCQADWRKQQAESALQTTKWWQHFMSSALFGTGVAAVTFLGAGAIFWATLSMLTSGAIQVAQISLALTTLLGGIIGFGFRQRNALLAGDPACPTWNWGRETWEEVIDQPLMPSSAPFENPITPEPTPGAPTPAEPAPNPTPTPSEVPSPTPELAPTPGGDNDTDPNNTLPKEGANSAGGSLLVAALSALALLFAGERRD